MSNVQIQVNTKYNGQGFEALKKDSQSTASLVKKAIGSFGFALGAREIFEFSKRAEEMGREMQQARTRLTQLLGSSEEYNKAIADMNQFTTLQGSELENAQASFLLLDSGIAKTTEEAAKLTNAGSILTEVFAAQGASQEKFMRLLTSGNDVLLDNFNLTRQQVQQRKEQIKQTTGLRGQEAKLQAVRELAIEKADELAGAISGEAKAAAEFKSAADDLTTTIGENLTPAFAKAKEGAAGFFEWLNRGIKAQRERRLQTLEMVHGQEEFNQLYGDYIKLEEEGTQTTKDNTQATTLNADAIKAAADRLKEVNDARRDFARSLIDIDEQAQQDDEDAWKDYFKSESNAWKDHQKELADINKQNAKDLVKIDKDLAKDLEKLARSTQKSLAKVDQDESKKIKTIKEDSAKKESQQARKRQIDVLGDERLFQFELRQLAARGQANQIQAALERRKIEEEIARDKQQVESQIEDEKVQDDIKRVKEAAATRRDELRANGQERRDQLKQDAEEEKQVRAERLAEEIQQEDESYKERLAQLRNYREEKLADIEKGKEEAIKALGRELAESQDLTASELAALVPVAGKFGKEAGVAFASGLKQGTQTLADIKNLVAPNISPGGGAGFGSTPGTLGSYAVGGTVPGPMGQPQLAVVHGGETITPPGNGGGNINLNPTIVIQGSATSETVDEIQKALQWYTDNVIAPLMN